MRPICMTISLLALVTLVCAHAQDVPATGPERLAWMREHLLNTVSKFEFTQGYSFRKNPENLRPFLEAIKAQGFDTWDQMAHGGIWDDEQFALLERSIQVAGEVGLKVWATLSPPSGTKEIARWPLEQRQQYYYDCAERFARLAGKYPTFVAFGTPLEQSFRNGEYTAPRLIDVARAALHAETRNISVFIGLYDEGLAVEGGSFLREGETELVRALELFNKTQDFNILRATCAGRG